MTPAFTKPSANRIRRIAHECYFPELLELISTAQFSEDESIAAPLDPLTFERFPELAGTGIEVFIANIWSGAGNETDGSIKLRRMRAAYLLAASFLRYDDSAQYALLYGKTLLQHGLPKRAIEPFGYAAMLRRKGQSAEWGADALFHLSLCQERLSHWDALLSSADEYATFAHETDLPDHVVCAILFKSKAQAALADRKGALSSLEQGLQEAQTLLHERRPLKVSALNSIAAIGDIIRTQGLHDSGVDVLVAFAATLHAPAERALLAMTLSEVGYTLINIGDQRGIAFLEKAAGMNVDPTLTSRWRHSVEVWQNIHGPATDAPGAADEDNDVGGRTDIFSQLTRVQRLLDEERYAEAKELARQVISRVADKSVRLSALTSLALSHYGLRETDAALRIAREAMSLASEINDPRQKMLAHRTLALIYLLKDQALFALSNLTSGMQLGEKILDRVSSLPFRRMAIMELNSLVELAAEIYCASGMYERLLHFLEFRRAPNLYKWMNLETTFESANLPERMRTEIREKARAVRAADVELDSDLFDGNFTPGRHVTLTKERDETQGEFDRVCRESGLLAPISSRIDSTFEPLAKRVLHDGIAIVSLFQGRERGLLVGAIQVNGKIQYFGKPLQTTLDSLRAIFEGMEGYTSSFEGGVVARKQTRDGAKESPLGRTAILEEVYDEALKSLRSFSDFRIEHLIVIPHDAFALLPWWRLADELDCSLTVAPSIGVAGVCKARQRQLHGPTVLVEDASGTLAYANAEVEAITASRSSDAPRLATLVCEVIDAAPEANLLSFSCHGIYDNRNPYRSHLKVEENSYGSNHDAGLTAKVVMTRFSLDHCRLAILSACESGVPDLHQSGEMTGLPNAFLVAGAKTVIASMWPVDDRATYILIRCFMREWAGGAGHTESPAVALKQARRALSTTTLEQALELLGSNADLPPGPFPFSDSTFVDAFHCFGTW
jgi:tetratricopeptide (TPR) repeat protein